MEMRQPPSGSVIKNSHDGSLAPGRGMMMRLAEQVVVVGGSQAITSTPQTLGTTLGGVGLTQSLDKPQPGRYYRATVCIDVTNFNATEGAELVLSLDTSTDGEPFVTRVKNLHLLGAGSGEDGDIDNGRHCRLDMVLQLGSDLGVVDGSDVLQVRAQIATVATVSGVEVDSRAASGPVTGAIGTCLLQLSEHL